VFVDPGFSLLSGAKASRIAHKYQIGDWGRACFSSAAASNLRQQIAL
jgi:hypothetical protein